MPLPQAIENAPELMLGLDLYLEAWYDLDASRDLNGNIPRKDVRDYAEEMEFSEDQTEALHHHVRAMEAVYRSHVEKKRNK